MAETRINGRNGTADISIAAVSYKTRMRSFNIESNVPQDDVTCFSTEAAPVYEAGIEGLRFDLMGFNTYAAANTGPLIPAPQGVAMVFTYFTGCTISFTGNFTRATASRQVGAHSMVTGEGFSTGAFTVTWAVS